MTKEERIKKYAEIVSKVNSAVTDTRTLQDDLIDQLQDPEMDLKEKDVVVRVEKAISELDIVLSHLERMAHTSIEFPE